MIFLKRGIFLCQSFIGIQWCEDHFRPIFSSLRELIESLWELAMNQIASSLLNVNDSERPKSLWARFFYVSTPFLLVVDNRMV